jgi:hypothetical protein
LGSLSGCSHGLVRRISLGQRVGAVRNAGRFFLSFRPNLRLKSGWSSWCKACCVERNRQWRAEHPEQKQAYNERRRVPPEKRACVECGAVFERRANQILCGRRSCKDKRYARLHPDKLKAKKQRRAERLAA